MTDFIFNHTFLLNMLYDYIIIYDCKIEGKKEREKERKKRKKERRKIQELVTRIVPLNGHLCTLFTPKSSIVVH